MKIIFAPIEAEPAHVFLNGFDVFDVFARRVRIVHAQMAFPAVFLRHAEIEANRLRVPDVQVAVRLGRETRNDALDRSRGEVVVDDLTNEVAIDRRRFRRNGFFAHSMKREKNNHVPAINKQKYRKIALKKRSRRNRRERPTNFI